MSLAESSTMTLPRPSFCSELSGLAGIYHEQVNLMTWQRTLDLEVTQAVEALLATHRTYTINQIVTPENVHQALARTLPKTETNEAFIRDVALLVDAYCCLFDLDTAGLRLTQVDRAMCPRFHVDQVPCRLITTYSGPATEWLEETSLNRQKLGRGSNGQPDSHSGLIAPNAEVQRITCGDVALLKGERWDGNEGRGAVHRSPAVDPGQSRLLLTLDMA